MAGNKLFFSIEIQGSQQTLKQLSDVELKLNEVNQAIREARKQGNSDAYKELRASQELLKQTSTTLKKELKEQQKAFETARYPTDSVMALELEYSKLRREIRAMSKEARESADGIAKIRFADKLKSEILSVNDSIKDFSSNIGNYKSAFAGIGDLVTGGLLTGGIAALGAGLADFAIQSKEAFEESQIAITGVATAVETTGKAAGFTVEQLAQEAENLMQQTVFDDDQILKDVTQQLLTFTNVTGENFLKAQKAALDLNTVLGGDLQGNTIQLGKALENPIKGVTALSKAGVTFTEQQKAQIKTLVESNKVQEAQAVILDEIAAKYGNQATALAQTDTGKLKQLSNIFGELQEQVGGFVVAGLGKIAPVVSTIIEGISKGLGYLYDNVLAPVGEAFSRLFDTIFEGANQSEILNKIFDYLGVVLSSIGSVLATVIDYTASVISYFKKLGQEIPLVGKAFGFVNNVIKGFVDFLTDIPALIASVLKGVSQFIQNVRNFDFSKGAINVAVDEFKRIREQRITEEVKKKTEEIRPSGAKKPTNGLIGEDDKEKEKARKKEEKSIEDQEKRIYEIKKKLAELTTQDIQNEYDKQIKAAELKYEDEKRRIEETKQKLDEKIKLQGGRAKGSDITEAKLIEEETKAIAVALEKQKDEIERKRKESFEKSKKQLFDLQQENLKLIESLQVEQVQAQLDTTNQNESQVKQNIELTYVTDKAKLDEQLANNEITVAKHKKAVETLEKEKEKNIVAAENKAAQERLQIAETLLQEKLQLLNIEEQQAILKANDIADAAKGTAFDDLQKGKIDYETYVNTLLDIDRKAALERQKIEQDTLIKKQQAEADKVKAVNDANITITKNNAKLTEQEIAEQSKLTQERKALLEQLISSALDIGRQISDSIFNTLNQNADKEKDTRLQKLDEEYNKRLEQAKGNAALEATLKKELEAKKSEIEKKAFEENKKRQIAQAIINGALAATAVFTVPDFTFGIKTAIQLGVIAANTAIQVAAIRNTKFAKGGFTTGLGFKDDTGEEVAGVVHGGEWVANRKFVESNPSLFEQLERLQRSEAFRPFANGGFVNRDYSKLELNAISPVRTSTVSLASFTDDQIKLLASEISSKVYEASKSGSIEGTAQGSKIGIYNGMDERNRLKEREDALDRNTTF